MNRDHRRATVAPIATLDALEVNSPQRAPDHWMSKLLVHTIPTSSVDPAERCSRHQPTPLDDMLARG